MMSLRPAGEETAGLHRILDCRQFHGADELGVAHRRDLLVGQGPHQAQFAEHLHVLFVMRGDLADRLLTGGDDVEVVAERQPLTQFGPGATSRPSHRLQRVCSPA